MTFCMNFFFFLKIAECHKRVFFVIAMFNDFRFYKPHKRQNDERRKKGTRRVCFSIYPFASF